ncbi:MAG: hypothetical protein A2909_01615 [Candidatus Tagabacteria bacterium RIFCSPLOWO2_01_FULL_39_11]|uniref:Uncharacterized protein n=1 Tax=Candidatus Tagabacteria bacterium RIFCSPLOWO2_01_FULL_39_11 TaxID=1802295 RepID=A0A1G2LTP4_9BACT|nr:MAG: hypothetical protein A2909_01615 [Candidatus Tagabacteria bacterium RIFCSPLOWO2_01_FULL_39_11]
MNEISKLKGANMDIGLTSDQNDINWEQDRCPWDEAEKTNIHKCAVKNISICDYFLGIENPDFVLCKYPKK